MRSVQRSRRRERRAVCLSLVGWLRGQEQPAHHFTASGSTTPPCDNARCFFFLILTALLHQPAMAVIIILHNARCFFTITGSTQHYDSTSGDGRGGGYHCFAAFCLLLLTTIILVGQQSLIILQYTVVSYSSTFDSWFASIRTDHHPRPTTHPTVVHRPPHTKNLT